MNLIINKELFKRANRGLYAGVKIGFGNNVSHSVRQYYY